MVKREQQGGVSSQELIKAIKDWNRARGIKQPVIFKRDLVEAETYYGASKKQ